MILSGVTVHHGAVIGARAVVAHDVPPYTVVAGNPAHTLRRRFDDETIDSLLAKAWWDWPDELISARADILCSGDIDRLLALST
jgi:virginiamycin A acetyltransferase